jgi:hypothetical protein
VKRRVEHKEEIRSEGGSLRSAATRSGGKDTRERDRHKSRTSIHMSWSNQLLTSIQAWYLYPKAKVEAFTAYYKYGPTTYGQY